MKPIKFLSIVLVLTFALVACTGNAPPVADEMTEEAMVETAEPMMEDVDPVEEPMDDMSDDTMSSEDMDAPMDEDMSMDDDMMADMTPVTFVVRIENIGAADGLTILAPGAYELNDHPVSFFAAGEPDRGEGLEALAEDGNPGVLVESIRGMMSGNMAGFEIGIFDTPAGASDPGPVGAGAAYEFTVNAYEGQYLTFATMFVQSNDWFFAPVPGGVALFDADGHPISGDITDLVVLWNAGTEVDQVPGEGPDQAPRQSGPNTGEAETGVVSQVEWPEYGIRVTITPQQ